ncbi:MAG TPA: hypothetical protein VJN96_06045 [Vicinamibacterales bacterium]|nr:hypothetical protein [Vicinamibacterales bacterium]
MTLLPARAALAIVLLASVCACGKVKANVPTALPVLDMPAPPGRLIVPSAIPEPAPEPVAPAPTQTPTRQNNPPATRASERSSPPASTATPPPEPTPPAAPPVLLTTPNAGDLEKKAQANIIAARADLERVKYSALSADAKLQYDTARQYLGQADDALKMKNYVFAGQLAEKAATLASLLVKSQGKEPRPAAWSLVPISF